MSEKKDSISYIDFIDRYSNKFGIYKYQSKEMIDDCFELLLDLIEQDYEVNIHGFGKFYKKDKAGKKVRHPKSKKMMEIKPYTTMQFKASDTVKKRFTE